MTKDTLDKMMPIKVPRKVAECPICGADVQIEEVMEWHEEQGGHMRVDLDSTVHFNCVTEPDIETDEWEDWHRGHWSMPYVDWLPLERPILYWLDRQLENDKGRQRDRVERRKAKVKA